MRKKLYSFILTGLLPAWIGQADTRGNGGDGVLCAASSANPLAGYYVLDYLVGYSQISVQPYYTGPEAPEGHLLNLLRAKAPDLASDLAAFLANAEAQIGHNPDFSKDEIWVAADLTNVDTQDQQLYEALPENCVAHGTNNQVTLRQAVVRTERPDSTIFKYDQAVFQSWLRNPLQLSFILTHEWLWSRVTQADFIRDVNQFLHRQSTDQIPDDQFEAILAKMGVKSVSPDTWITRTLDEVVEQFRAILSPGPQECAFLPTADASVKAWWMAHGKEVLGKLESAYGWYYPYEENSPCVDFSISPGVVNFRQEICRRQIHSFRAGKIMLMTALLEEYGIGKDVSEGKAIAFVDSTNSALCPE